jgi:adenylate cyclase
MNCFECGMRCITQYWWHQYKLNELNMRSGWKVTHINQKCNMCLWESNKYAIPGKIPRNAE